MEAELIGGREKSIGGTGGPAGCLSAEQIADFHHNGFLSLTRVTSDSEVAWFREKIAAILQNRKALERGDYFDFGTAEDETEFKLPQMTRVIEYAPELLETTFHKNAAILARQLLGPQAEFIFDHAMLKPAETGRPTPWHQDQAFHRKGSDIESLTIWMPLQDVTKESGCLNFVPGSHLEPLLVHQSINNDSRVHGLEAIGVDASRAVCCPLSAGGATIHHDGTLHSAGANMVPRQRFAYAVIYGIRIKEVLKEDYPWNVGKLTERERRRQSSRTLGERMRDRARSIRLGLSRH